MTDLQINSEIIKVTADGAVGGTEELRSRKGGYTLSIPRYLNCIKVTAIDSEAFSSKEGEKSYSFTSLILPDSLSKIGEKAFMSCTGLTSVTAPNGVSTIGDYAFADCRNLKSFTFGDGITSIGKGAFSSCSSLAEVKMKDNVRSIGDETFKDCTNLTSVTLSRSLESI
ncbi:MAG: leucine-rich repeat domain-containing protein [Candidatus Ornithospirochaeta sp.]